MTADTITLQRVRDLESAFATAAESMRCLAVAVLASEITPAQAAEEINETIANLSRNAQ